MEHKSGNMAAVLSVKQFDGKGFSNWEFRVKLILEQHGVLDVLKTEVPTNETEAVAFNKKDVKARNIIVQCLADNVLEMIKNKKTAKEIVDELRGTYTKVGIATQVQLQRKLRTLKYDGKGSLNEFIIDFEKPIAELKGCGSKMESSEVITQLLSAMPDTYQPVTTAIDILFCQDNKTVTLDFVKNKLLMEEARQMRNKSENGESQAFVGYKKKYSNKPSCNKYTGKEGNSSNGFRYKCFHCGERGHKKSECPSRKKPQKGANCSVVDCEEEEK